MRIDPKTIYQERDNLPPQQVPNLGLLNTFAEGRGNPHETTMRYGDNLAGMHLSNIGDKDINQVALSYHGLAHSEPLAALNSLNALNSKVFENTKKEGLYQPKDGVRHPRQELTKYSRDQKKGGLMYTPQDVKKEYFSSMLDGTKEDQLKYLFNNTPNYKQFLTKQGADVEWISERPYCDPKRYNCAGFVNDFSPDGSKLFYTAGNTNLVDKEAKALLQGYQNYKPLGSQQEQAQKQEEDRSGKIIVTKNAQGALQFKPKPVLELEEQIRNNNLKTHPTFSTTTGEITRSIAQQGGGLDNFKKTNKEFYNIYGNIFEALRDGQADKDYYKHIKNEAKRYDKAIADKLPYNAPGWMDNKLTKLGLKGKVTWPKDNSPPGQTLSQQMNQPIINSFSNQRPPSPQWNSELENNYSIRENLGDVSSYASDLRDQRKQYEIHQRKKGNNDPFQRDPSDYNNFIKYAQGGYVNNYQNSFSQPLPSFEELYNNSPYGQNGGQNLQNPQQYSDDMNEGDDMYDNQYSTDPSNMYADGGYVDEDLPSLAEMIRQRGGEEDTVLAHINPLEAQMLKNMGGSGHINPETGLPQYGLGGILGSIAGAFIGGPAGSAIGGGLGSMIGGKKKKKPMTDAQGIAYALASERDEDPGFLSMLGSRSKDFLSDPRNLMSIGSAAAGALKRPKKERSRSPEEIGADNLRMMMAARLSPEETASQSKRLSKALRMTPEEMVEESRYQQALERAAWEARNNLQPGETLDFDPVYRKDLDEEERKKKGRWFEYYNDPEFVGKRVNMKEGGSVKPVGLIEMMSIKKEPHDHDNSCSECGSHKGNHGDHEENNEEGISLAKLLGGMLGGKPNTFSGYVSGHDGGQDDTIDAKLSSGEYVMDADFVSAIGDGNSENGARKLDEARRNLRRHKSQNGDSHIPPKAFGLGDYM